MRDTSWILTWYLGSSPTILVTLAGLVASLVFVGSAVRRAPAICVALATGLYLLQLLSGPWIQRWIIESGESSQWIQRAMSTWGVIASFLHAVGLVLLLVAAFGWRSSAAAMPAGWIPGRDPSLSDAPQLPPLSAGLRLLMALLPLALAWCLSVLSLFLGYSSRNMREPAPMIALAFAAFLLAIGGAIAVTMNLHASWKTIEPPPQGVGLPGVARTTAGRAVGFLFLPFFNLYWVFQAIPGLATDMNRTLAERGRPGPRVSRGAAITYCICAILGWIPFVALVASPVAVICLAVFLNGALGGANALRRGTPGTIETGAAPTGSPA